MYILNDVIHEQNHCLEVGRTKNTSFYFLATNSSYEFLHNKTLVKFKNRHINLYNSSHLFVLLLFINSFLTHQQKIHDDESCFDCDIVVVVVNNSCSK